MTSRSKLAAVFLGFVMVVSFSYAHPFGNPRSQAVQPRAPMLQHAQSLLGAGDSAVSGGDPMRGKATFDRRCTGCHAIDADREGPRLRGAFGSRAGTKPDFAYSDNLKKSGIVWTDTTLDRWLQDPDATVPGNAMDFSVPKPQDRADIVAYLKTLK